MEGRVGERDRDGRNMGREEGRERGGRAEERGRERDGFGGGKIRREEQIHSDRGGDTG